MTPPAAVSPQSIYRNNKPGVRSFQQESKGLHAKATHGLWNSRLGFIMASAGSTHYLELLSI